MAVVWWTWHDMTRYRMVRYDIIRYDEKTAMYSKQLSLLNFGDMITLYEYPFASEVTVEILG